MASSEELLRAVQLATRTLSGSGQIDELLLSVLSICVEAVGASGGTIYIHDEAKKALVFRHVLPESVREKIQFENIPDDFGVAGESFQKGKTVISRFEPKERQNSIERQTGVEVTSMITVPLMMKDEEPIGVVQLINKKEGDFDDSDAIVLDTVASVSTLAYINSKLADDATRASTLLGMGKVSHDIGNLAASMYAIISFSDADVEAVRRSQTADEAKAAAVGVEETINGLKTSVDRIVGYSRLISDLSANRQLRPEKKPGKLAEVVENAASYLESEARQNDVSLTYDISTNSPDWSFDELFMFRIVQNLVGNAIKAVHENADSTGGAVIVGYKHEDGQHVIWVKDSGPGMSQDVADRILAGNARSMWAKGGGSGWGTKIVLELAASHDGKVDIQSEPGAGATFFVRFPA